MAEEEKKEDQKKDGDKKAETKFNDDSVYQTSHEGEWWVRQTGNVVVENCVPETKKAIIDMGKWFFEHTGHALVISSGTDGEHAISEHCHANGWKFDCIDYGGPEGLNCQFFGDGIRENGTQLMYDFIAYGNSLGLGVNIEGNNPSNDHLDVAVDGNQWAEPNPGVNYGGYRNPSGAVPNFSGKGNNPAGGGPSGNGNAFMNNIKDNGGMLELMPSGKTYAESVYPDYVYVQGNIPCSPIEKTVVNKTGELDKNGPYNMMTSRTMKDLTGLESSSFTNGKAMEQAQRAFDPTACQLEVKVPNAGKPLNNNDPFPADLKIEELERHLPRVKQYKMPYDKNVGATKSIAAALLHVSDYAEKRIVRLENNMATLMRYLFAMGSRVAINCVYYGGQDHRSKYTCIRCLKDNRVEDGQVMQIDQCLSCSRYEPIIGQTYDIMNEVGSNLANIEDDMQMAYMNMDEYINFLRVEKMHDPKKAQTLAYINQKTRNPNDVSFKDQWNDGIKMSWKLTPVENQKPQINWRKDINSEDKSPDKLDSYQAGPGQASADPGSTLGNGAAASQMQQHLAAMQKILDDKPKETKDPQTGETKKEEDKYPTARPAITNGFKQGESAAKTALEAMKNNGYEQALQNACSNASSFDPVLAFSIAAILSSGAINGDGLFKLGGEKPEDQTKAGIDHYNELKKAHGKGENPIGPVQAWSGWKDGLDSVNKDNSTYDEAWAKAVGGDTFFPAVVKAYETIAKANTSLSQMSNKPTTDGSPSIEFPLKTGDLAKAYFVQDFGATSAGGTIALVSDAVSIELKESVPVYAPIEGSYSKVVQDESYGNCTTVKANNGRAYLIGGLDSWKDLNGDVIHASDQIGMTTNRLVLKVTDNGQAVDPKTVWPSLSGKCSTEASLGEQVAKENSIKADNE